MTQPTPPPAPGDQVSPGTGMPVPPQPTPPKQKPHVLGIIALVTAAVGFIFACMPGALIVGWVLLPIAFILAIVALFLKGRKWPAVVGLILAVVGTVIGFVVFFAVVANAATEAFGGTDSSGAKPSQSAVAAQPDSAKGDYAVTIDGATQTKDYEGKPALIVNFTFTNNSDKDANFMFATSAKAFQKGVELEDAIVTDDSFDSASGLKDIKPGKSIKTQQVYVLTGKTDVTVEVKELISLSDNLLATKKFSVK